MQLRHLLFAVLLSAYASEATAQSCSCLQNFDFATEKIRLNYSGYRDKVTPQTEAALAAHTAQQRAKAAAAQADTSCFWAVYNWLKFFRDGHVQLGQSAAPAIENPEAVRAQFASAEKIALTETEARQYLDQPGRTPVEGIWVNAEGNYRVAVTRQPNADREFAASVLRADSVYWMPGQVKFELRPLPTGGFSARYRMRDHSLRPDTATFDNGVLQMGIGTWYRQYPGTPVALPSKGVFRLEMLDSTTALLVIPTMDESVRSQLDNLLKINQKLLASTPNLVIDCRNNGGGSDITYRLVSPLLYTQRTTRYRMQVWATKDNAQKYANLQKNKNYPFTFRAYGWWMKGRIRRHYGEFIGKKGVSKNKKEHYQAYPARVAVLINGGCGSSCESFVEEADQSKKVTLIGANTAGVTDYGNLHTLPMPCYNFELRYPTTRTSAIDLGKGVDNVGHAPDVRLGKETADWVEFARQYLHGQMSNTQ